MSDVFEKLGIMYNEIYKLDPAKFLSPPALAWQAAKVKLDLLTDIDMLLMT